LLAGCQQRHIQTLPVLNGLSQGPDLADKNKPKITHLERQSFYIYWLGIDNFILMLVIEWGLIAAISVKLSTVNIRIDD
jgi:hypothetical protein